MVKALLDDGKIFLTFLLISTTLIFTDRFGLLDIPKSIIQTVTVPIQFGLYRLSVDTSRQLEFMIMARRASQENKALNEQLAQVLSENADLRRRLAEVEGFLQQQNTLSPKEYNLIPARPIGTGRYLLLDKGASDGIRINQTVIFKDNYIGQVKYVSPHRAQVMLASDPDSKLASFAANKDGQAKGILNGEFGSDIIMDKILHKEPVAPGDLVYSEGTGSQTPRGLILGRVSEVMSNDNEVFKQAKVKPVFESGSLDIVFVIKE